MVKVSLQKDLDPTVENKRVRNRLAEDVNQFFEDLPLDFGSLQIATSSRILEQGMERLSLLPSTPSRINVRSLKDPDGGTVQQALMTNHAFAKVGATAVRLVKLGMHVLSPDWQETCQGGELDKMICDGAKALGKWTKEQIPNSVKKAAVAVKEHYDETVEGVAISHQVHFDVPIEETEKGFRNTSEMAGFGVATTVSAGVGALAMKAFARVAMHEAMGVMETNLGKRFGLAANEEPVVFAVFKDNIKPDPSLITLRTLGLPDEPIAFGAPRVNKKFELDVSWKTLKIQDQKVLEVSLSWMKGPNGEFNFFRERIPKLKEIALKCSKDGLHLKIPTAPYATKLSRVMEKKFGSPLQVGKDYLTFNIPLKEKIMSSPNPAMKATLELDKTTLIATFELQSLNYINTKSLRSLFWDVIPNLEKMALEKKVNFLKIELYAPDLKTNSGAFDKLKDRLGWPIHPFREKGSAGFRRVIDLKYPKPLETRKLYPEVPFKMTPQDLGIHPEVISVSNAPKQIHVDGWLTLEDHVLNIQINEIKAPRGFSFTRTGIEHLMKIGDENGALRVLLKIKSPTKAFIKNFGPPIKTDQIFQTFSIPL